MFFMTPIREGGVPMPASVLKFDAKACHLECIAIRLEQPGHGSAASEHL